MAAAAFDPSFATAAPAQFTMPAAAPAAAPAEEHRPTSIATKGFHSLHAKAAEVHRAHVEARAAQRPAKKVADQKKEKAKKANTTRRPGSEICGTIMPPSRVQACLRAAMETPESKRHAEATKYIRDLQKALTNPDPTQPPLTEEQVQMINQRIAGTKQMIETEQLAQHVVRVADDAPAALASACDFIIISMIDILASNTHSAGKKTVETKYTLAPEFRPSEEEGGIRLEDCSAWPFIHCLDPIQNYSQAVEDQIRETEAAQRKAAQDEKEKAKAEREERLKAQKTALAAQYLDQLNSTLTTYQNVVTSGVPTTFPNGMTVTVEDAQKMVVQVQQNIQSGSHIQMAEKVAADNEKAERPPAKRKASSERSFMTYITTLCQASQDLHDAYAGMRVAGRLKHIIDEVILQFIDRFGKVVRTFISSNTLNGKDVKAILCSLQLFAGRSEDEIDSLSSVVQTAMGSWKAHTSSERERRKEAEAAKQNQMTAEQLAALQRKKLEAECKRLESSLEAQRRRAKKAEEEAAKKVASLQQAQSTLQQLPVQPAGAPAASAAPAAFPGANGVAGFVTGMPGSA